MTATLKVDTIKEVNSSVDNLVLDSSGNVTVGNNLTVAGTTTFTGGQTFNGNLTLNTPSTTTARNINWSNGTGTVATVAGYSDSTTTGHLEFYTLASGTTPTERMRIDSAGLVGIGSTSPSSRLTIEGTANNVNSEIRITATATASGYLGCNSNGLNIGVDTGGLIFKTGVPGGGPVGSTGTERARIASGGNFGIGTDSPYAKLSVYIGNGTYAYMNTGNTTENGNVPWLAASNNVDVSVATYGWYIYDSESTGNLTIYRRNNSTTGNKVMEFNRGSGAVTVVGALSKGSGSFRIDHPLPEKEQTHQLVHSFIEGPQADLIYRGVAKLVDGEAIINIDESSGMTEGTFELLCRDVQCFTTNEDGWDLVRGKVVGNILTIESQNNSSTASVSWLVIGERQDKHMMETDWTDENGKVIVEPLKEGSK